MDVRFTAPVFPGETVQTEIWREHQGSALFRCKVIERNRVVLDNGLLEFAATNAASDSRDSASH